MTKGLISNICLGAPANYFQDMVSKEDNLSRLPEEFTTVGLKPKLKIQYLIRL